jgi:hypothetical protein
MRTPPQDLTEAEVGVAVAAHWDVVAFTEPHQRTTDTELAWQGSITICHRLATNSR